jgi:tetratricopeptide (TPR) repeat protein
LNLSYNRCGFMSEIQRRDLLDDAVTSGDDRDAKIEQLLLVGLDHYFAAQYEHAINVWTRALFLDRNHARARAYIERARSTLAERQRQSEELLQTGVAAFRCGEADKARRLLQAAIESGAPPEEALAILERLNPPTQSDPMPAADGPSAQPAREVRFRRRVRTARRRSAAQVVAWVLVLSVGVALGGFVSAGRVDWTAVWSLVSMTEPPAAAGIPAAQDQSLPLPRRGEMALARARALAASGKLHDALGALDEVRATDQQQGEADKLRADIQRQLISLTTLPPPAPRRLP